MLENYCRTMKPEMLITCLDVWLDQTAYLSDLTRKMNIPWICHVTINSEPLALALKNRITSCKLIVAPSKYNYRVLLQAGLTKSVYIPHGVDLKSYYPSTENEKNQMKKNLGVENKFVFLCVARNKGMQKNFQQLFTAYKRFLNENPTAQKDSVLLILNDPYEIDGFPLIPLRNSLGLDNNVRFVCSTPKDDWSEVVPTYEGDPNGFYSIANWRFTEEWMRKIYGCADVHITLSQGESFGLPILESMACGIPQIFPNHTVGPELIGEPNTGLLVNVNNYLLTPLISNVFFIDEADASAKMKTLYDDANLRKNLGQNGYDFAQDYDWDIIIDKWKKLVQTQELIA